MSDIDARFEKWWDDDVLFPSKYIDPILLEEDDSPIYWAHQGWQAGYESQQAEITRLNAIIADRTSDILNYDKEEKRLKAIIADNEIDARRLDFLESVARMPILVASKWFIDGKTFRQAIDQAMNEKDVSISIEKDK